VSPKAFLGPLDRVGCLDLTDRIHAEELYERFNAPSFSPHTSRGRIFGLPHDVHPTVLAYRADLVEEAGVDVSEIETWKEPFYHAPDPFYCGQAAGSLLIEVSPEVPLRPSSPYWQNAFSHISNSLIALRSYAERHAIYDIEELTPVALRLLQNAQAELENLISRNVFLEERLHGDNSLGKRHSKE